VLEQVRLYGLTRKPRQVEEKFSPRSNFPVQRKPDFDETKTRESGTFWGPRAEFYSRIVLTALFSFQGYVTTFSASDLKVLRKLLSSTPCPLKQAGLHPTVEQIELYSYYLPKASLSNIVVSIAQTTLYYYSLWKANSKQVILELD